MAEKQQDWSARAEFVFKSHDALNNLNQTREEHSADAHETYFQANGENYRIRIERIPSERKAKHV